MNDNELKKELAEWAEDALHDELFNIKEDIVSINIDSIVELLAKIKYAKLIQNELSNR